MKPLPKFADWLVVVISYFAIASCAFMATLILLRGMPAALALQDDRMGDTENVSPETTATTAAVVGTEGVKSRIRPHGTKVAPAKWRRTRATFYGAFYDTGPGRFNKTADGTRYKSSGMFCATGLVPLGTVIEVNRGTVTLRLTVRDRQAPKFRHLIDIPTKTWDRFGAKRSTGHFAVRWRVVK